MLESVVKIKYNPDFNSVLIRSRRVRLFLENISQEVTDHFLRVVLDNVISEDDCGVHLNCCLGSGPAVSNFSISEDGRSIGDMNALSMLVFPRFGKIKKYILNPKSAFFSNIHQDSDPVLVTEIEEGIPLHSKITGDFLYFGRDNYVPNMIKSGLLFKEDIKKYVGFEEYLKYYDNESR